MGSVHYFKLYGCMLALIFTGCIKENLEICIPQSVQMTFTFIASKGCEEDPVNSADINRLTVFIFDQHGRFVEQLDATTTGADYQIKTSLIPAHYKLVAVAGFDDEQLRGIPFEFGVTNIRGASITSYLKQQDESLQSAGHVLYMGTDTLTVMPEIAEQSLAMTLIQQTKMLDIMVNGIATSHYQVALSGNAARYSFGMTQYYLEGSPLVYVPLHEDNGVYEGTTLVNWPLKNDGDNTRLQIINRATGTRLVNEDLMELILRVPDIDLECSTGFHIEIEYKTAGGITISIENWKVYDDGYILI